MNSAPPRRLYDALTILACVLVVFAFAAPTIYYCAPDGNRLACDWSIARHGATDDWRYFGNAWEAARVSLSTFRQFPSWNPYHCGGVVLYQDPQSPFPGPFFLLTFFWLPTPAAFKVWIISHLLIGALGARVFARSIGGNRAEQVLAAGIVAACGFCGWHFGGGHLSFTPFLFFPWLLFAHRRALREPRWALVVAGLLALTVYEGGTYPLPLMLVALGFDSLARLGDEADRRGLLLSLSLVGLLFPLLAAARLLPVLSFLGEHPRLVPLDDSMTVAEVFQTWLTREHTRHFPGHVYVWNEFGIYIGIVPVVLLVAGVTVTLLRKQDTSLLPNDRRERRIDLFVFVCLLWCALGNIPGFSLFGLLHELPIYRSLRVPSRFLYPATVLGALLAVSALVAARRSLEAQALRPRVLRALRALEILVVFGVSADLVRSNAPLVQAGVDPPLPRVAASDRFYQATGTDYHRIATFPARGIGTRQCYVAVEWHTAPGVWDGPQEQVRVHPPNAGNAEQIRWTPNAVTFRATLERPGVVLLNQSFESSWRASAGRVGSFDPGRARVWHPGDDDARFTSGLLAVELPAGRHEVTVRHLPRGLGAGLAATLLGLVLTLLAALRLTPARVEAGRAWLRNKLTTSNEAREDAPAAPPGETTAATETAAASATETQPASESARTAEPGPR